MQRIAFRIVLAYAALSYTLFLLGLSGHLSILNLEFCLGLFLAGVSSLLALEMTRLRRLSSQWKVTSVGWLAILTVVIYSHALLLPPFARDDMIYHLQVPKQIAMAGRIAFDPFNVNSNFPFLFEMPLVIREGLHSTVSPFLPNIVFGLLFVMVLYSALRKNAIPLGTTATPSPELGLSKGLAVWAALALATTPVLVDLTHTCYVEIFFALLILLAALAYLEVRENAERGVGYSGPWLRACTCLGLASAVKYPGLIFLALFSAHAFATLRPRKLFYAGLILAIACASPWYFKSWLWTGNPVFPLADSIFHSPSISPMRLLGFHHMLADFHMGKTPMDFLKLPIRLAMGVDHAIPGVGMGFDGRLSILVLVAMLGFGWRAGNQRRLSTAITVVYFAVWAAESQQTRFLLAVIPFAAVFGFRRLAGFPRGQLWINAICALALLQNTVNLSRDWAESKVLDVLEGSLSRNAFLSKQMPISYGWADEINKRLIPSENRLMTVGTFGRNYYFQVPVLSNMYYEQEIFRSAFERRAPHPDSIEDFLKANKITHLLFNWDYVRRMHSLDADFDQSALEAYFQTHFRLVMKSGEVSLFQTGK